MNEPSLFDNIYEHCSEWYYVKLSISRVFSLIRLFIHRWIYNVVIHKM